MYTQLSISVNRPKYGPLWLLLDCRFEKYWYEGLKQGGMSIKYWYEGLKQGGMSIPMIYSK